MEKPLIIPDSYTYKQIADFAYIAESLGGFEFMFKDSKSKSSLDRVCHNSTQLQAKYNNFELYLDNFGIDLEKFKSLDVKKYFNLKASVTMRHSYYLRNIFFRYYNPKLTEKLYEFHELFNTNKLANPGVRTYFGYRKSQIKAIERAASFGKMSKLPTNSEYNMMYDFEGLSPKYMLFTRYKDIKNKHAQFGLDVKASLDLTMDLMLLTIDRKETSYDDFLMMHSIKKEEIVSMQRYTSIVEYYRRYRSLISRYKEIIEDINGGCNWTNFLYKYELDTYGLEERQKFAKWLDKVVPIKYLLKKEI